VAEVTNVRDFVTPEFFQVKKNCIYHIIFIYIYNVIYYVKISRKNVLFNLYLAYLEHIFETEKANFSNENHSEIFVF